MLELVTKTISAKAICEDYKWTLNIGKFWVKRNFPDFHFISLKLNFLLFCFLFKP